MSRLYDEQIKTIQGETFDKLTKKFDEAAKEYTIKYLDSPKAVQEYIEVLIGHQVQSVIAQLLGFSKRWDKWEFDNCNGRRGIAEQALQTNVESGVKAWLAAAFGKPPEPPEELKDLYQSRYAERFKRALMDAAEEQGKQDAQEYIASLRVAMSKRAEELLLALPVKKAKEANKDVWGVKGITEDEAEIE